MVCSSEKDFTGVLFISRITSPFCNVFITELLGKMVSIFGVKVGIPIKNAIKTNTIIGKIKLNKGPAKTINAFCQSFLF